MVFISISFPQPLSSRGSGLSKSRWQDPCRGMDPTDVLGSWWGKKEAQVRHEVLMRAARELHLEDPGLHYVNHVTSRSFHP